jgi:predicted hotdog family 3-hydroxylacyl-ACP dehydratase
MSGRRPVVQLARALPPIERLIPHRGIMLLLEGVSAGDDAAIETHATVPATAWYIDEEGSVPAWIGIELMAQAVAAHVGLRGWLAGTPPKPGVLLGSRAYRASASSVPPGTLLRVSARMSYSDASGFGVYDCAIRSKSGHLASAALKVYQPADFAAFLESAANA